MFKKIFLFLFVGLLLLPLSASAQWGAAKTNLETVGGKTGLETSLETSVGTVIASALALVGTIFLILTVYAGILWMTAQGNEEKVTKAKNIIEAAIIGLVITMAAYAITSFVTGRLAGGGGEITTPTTADQCIKREAVCGSGCSQGTQIGACSDNPTMNICCKQN